MSTGTMPVAALAATLMLALPAAEAAAGVSSPHLRDAGVDDAGTGERQGSVQIAERGGQAMPARAPKQGAGAGKGPQVAALAPVSGASMVAKPGAKPRVTGPVPRAASHAVRASVPPRPTARMQPVRTTPGQARGAAPMPMVISPSLAPAQGPVAMPTAGHAQGPVHHAVGHAQGPVHQPVARAPHLVGVASYYSRRFDGRLMANGQRFDPHSDSIAHRTLPFGTRVRIVNMTNGRAVMGTVRDRGPFTRGRLLDVSPRIAGELGMIHSGIARVAVWHDGRDTVELAEAP